MLKAEQFAALTIVCTHPSPGDYGPQPWLGHQNHHYHQKYPVYQQSNPNQRHLSSGDHGSQSWQNSRPLLKGTTFLKLPELHHHDDHVSEEGNDEEDDDCDVDDHDIDYEKDENERDGEK